MHPPQLHLQVNLSQRRYLPRHLLPPPLLQPLRLPVVIPLHLFLPLNRQPVLNHLRPAAELNLHHPLAEVNLLQLNRQPVLNHLHRTAELNLLHLLAAVNLLHLNRQPVLNRLRQVAINPRPVVAEAAVAVAVSLLLMEEVLLPPLFPVLHQAQARQPAALLLPLAEMDLAVKPVQ